MEWGLDFFDEADEKWFESIKDVFDKFDHDGNGHLDREELGNAIREVCPHMKVSDEDIHKIFIRMDLDGDRTISSEEFFLELEEVYDEEIPDETPEELFGNAIRKHIYLMNKKVSEFQSISEVFNSFDGDHNGNLDYNEFARAVMKVGVDMDDDDLTEAFNMIDTSGDGAIDSTEFVFMCCAISLRYPALEHAGPLDVFKKCLYMLRDVAQDAFEPVGDWEPKPRMTRRMSINIPDEAPGDISDPEFVDDGLPVTVVCDDASKQIRLTKTQARLAVQITAKMNEGLKSDEGVWFDTISKRALELVCDYLVRKNGRRPQPIDCPIFSREMKKLCQDPWDAVFIDKLTKVELFEFIQGCHTTGVHSGLRLGCCKIACLYPRGMNHTPDSIRRWLSFDRDAFFPKSQEVLPSDEQVPTEQFDGGGGTVAGRFQRTTSVANPFAGRSPAGGQAGQAALSPTYGSSAARGGSPQRRNWGLDDL